MAEPVWDVKYLYEAGVSEAAQSKEELTIKHFWRVADRELAGPAPTTREGLVARAWNYHIFDQTMAERGDAASNTNIAASVQREKIRSNFSKPSCTDDFLRLMCKTNLLFLGREIFNKALTFSTHAPVCNFFVQKDPSKKIEEQDETKERLLLYPRGSFKSSIDAIDCVQWFINFPDIRIVILTAESGLAVTFIKEIKKYFLVPKDAAPTIFQDLFPKWNLTPSSMGTESVFNCPCRIQGDDQKRDPSAWASSILSNLPGWHCDVMKMDDAVNNKNSETSMLVAKVKEQAGLAEILVDPGGYKDYIGTPYASNDFYNHKIEVFPNPEDLRKLITPARWLRPEAEGKDERDCTAVDYELLFERDKTGRERLTHKRLDAAKKNNLGIYLSQFMLNAGGIRKIKFALDLMIQRTVNPDVIPQPLQYYVLWDFAYASSQANDYSVGAVVGLDIENRAYVVEISRDHYIDSDLAREVVSLWQKYQARSIAIENSNGAQFLEQSIRRYAEEVAGNKYIPLDFFKTERSPNAKASRVGALQPLLLGGQLFFASTIECLDDLYKEFKDFGTALHDDIPDAISFLHKILPSGTPEPGGPGGRERQEDFDRMLRERDLWDLIHGSGDRAPSTQELPLVPETGTGDASGEPLYDPYPQHYA
jgi:predicted phage terminase large subunit-like protein